MGGGGSSRDLFHPAGRFPVQKVVHGTSFHLEHALVDGEQALLERLDTFARIPERWRYLYHDDEFGRTARVSDPMELGEIYEPAHWLGQGLKWDALAAGGGDFSKVHDALKTKELRWILVNDASMHPVLLEWGQSLEKEMAGDLEVELVCR